MDAPGCCALDGVGPPALALGPSPQLPQAVKDGENVLRGGDWASPRNLNLRDKVLAFRNNNNNKQKKATGQLQAVRMSEKRVASTPVPSNLGSLEASQMKIRVPGALRGPAQPPRDGSSGARWGAGADPAELSS